MALNLSKGFKRVGLIAVGAWWAFLAYILLSEGPLEIREGRIYHLLAYLFILALFVVPPLLVMGVIALGRWVWAGFSDPSAS